MFWPQVGWGSFMDMMRCQSCGLETATSSLGDSVIYILSYPSALYPKTVGISSPLPCVVYTESGGVEPGKWGNGSSCHGSEDPCAASHTQALKPRPLCQDFLGYRQFLLPRLRRTVTCPHFEVKPHGENHGNSSYVLWEFSRIIKEKARFP